MFAFRRLFRAETNSPYAVEFAALENSAAVLAGQMPRARWDHGLRAADAGVPPEQCR